MPDEQFIIRRRGSDELRRMNDWWAASPLRGSLDERTAMRVELCLNEALGNVLEHGYGTEAEPWARISLNAESGGVRILVEDHAPAFNPLEDGLKDMAEDLEQTSIGGRGVLLIRRYTDELEYRRVGDRNCLSMFIKPKVG